MPSDLVNRTAVDRVPGSVHQVPCRLLAHPKSTPDFVTADTILAVQHEPQRDHPFIDPDRRVFHDRPGLQSELPLRMVSGTLPPANAG